MHTETLAPDTKEIFAKLAKVGLPDNFYLSGGTALALHLGHRESVDLDFFSHEEFEPEIMQRLLEKEFHLEEVVIDSGTLNCFADKVKLQFLFYPYKLLEVPKVCEGIKISSIQDIACTKLLTISARGSKKDFIDLYFILDLFALPELFGLLKKKYNKQDYNLLHILKSLVYFDDADEQPSPRMHKEVSWVTVKKVVVQNVKGSEIL